MSAVVVVVVATIFVGHGLLLFAINVGKPALEGG
jgi:hypothetical protein